MDRFFLIVGAFALAECARFFDLLDFRLFRWIFPGWLKDSRRLKYEVSGLRDLVDMRFRFMIFGDSSRIFESILRLAKLALLFILSSLYPFVCGILASKFFNHLRYLL